MKQLLFRLLTASSIVSAGCGSSTGSGRNSSEPGNGGGGTVGDSGIARTGDDASSGTSGESSGDASPGAGGSPDAGAGTPSADASCVPQAGPAPADAPGCAGTSLYLRPSDPSARGPWAVGAHTSTIDGFVTEVWYPAKWGSDSCHAPVTYDIREHLPASEQAKIPDSANPLQICDCYRDLPIDDTHGPYPVITFIHGTAAFRTQSLTFATHWASRGFIVISSDHPGIQLSDFLGGTSGTSDEQGDAIKVLSALDTPKADLAFLAGHMDMTREGASGHSAGGSALNTIAGMRTGVQVVIPMAAGGVTAGGSLASSLILSAADDGIANPSGQTNGYSSTPAPKRFVQIANAGHLTFSDLCYIGASQGGLLAIAEKYGVQSKGLPISLLATLSSNGCSWQTGANYIPITPQQGWAVVNFATSAVFESVLMCDPNMAAQIAAIQSQVPNVASYQQQLQ